MVKLIFLDIDGVLVTRRISVFEDSLLKNLKRIVDETGAKIVLSSDWRRHPQARAEAKRVLNGVGLTFISCTPCLSAFIAQRPTEIMQWKRDYTRQPNCERVSHWVAIDDRPLLEERHGNHLQGHFVQTQPLRGLIEDKVDECIRILNQEVPAGSSGDTMDDPLAEREGRPVTPLQFSLPQARGAPTTRAPGVAGAAGALAKRGASMGPGRGFPSKDGLGSSIETAAAAAATLATAVGGRSGSRSVSNPPGAAYAGAPVRRSSAGAAGVPNSPGAGRGRGGEAK